MSMRQGPKRQPGTSRQATALFTPRGSVLSPPWVEAQEPNWSHAAEVQEAKRKLFDLMNFAFLLIRFS